VYGAEQKGYLSSNVLSTSTAPLMICSECCVVGSSMEIALKELGIRNQCLQIGFLRG